MSPCIIDHIMAVVNHQFRLLFGYLSRRCAIIDKQNYEQISPQALLVFE